MDRVGDVGPCDLGNEVGLHHQGAVRLVGHGAGLGAPWRRALVAGDLGPARERRAHGRAVLHPGGLEELLAVHARHDEVGEDHVHRLALEHLEGRLAVLGRAGLEARALKDAPQALAVRGLVVDHQDARFDGHAGLR